MRNRDGLQTTQKTIVLGVAADPEPDDLIVFQKTESSVATADTNRVNRLNRVHSFELQTWMAGILAKQRVSLACEVSDFARQLAIRRPESRRCTRPHSLSGSSSVVLPAARSARASAASFVSASLEASNRRVHCSSSRSSSSSHAATRSCSSVGNAASLAIASFNARVMTRVYRISSQWISFGNEVLHA